MAPGAARCGAARGFTLLEVLVVVFIVGVLSSAVLIVAAPGDAVVADREARKLATLLELALSEARASGQSMAWLPEPAGYSFWRLTASGEWARLPDTGVYRRRALAGRAELRDARVDSQALAAGERIVLSPHGLRSPFEIRIMAGQREIVLRGGILGRVSLERLHAD
jgi:general secretion pathway protein H